MQYKALLSDVDGTLILNKRDGLPSQRVREAIAKAQKIIHIGVATSRPLFFMRDIFDTLPLSGPCVVSGGTQIYDATTKKVVMSTPIEVNDFWAVVDVIEPHFDRLQVNEGHQELPLTRHYKPHENSLGIFIQGITPELGEMLIDKVSNIPGVVAHKLMSHDPGKMDIDVTNAKATKQHGVLQVAEILGIDTKQIIGIGDGYNDFPLLMACGFRVAMGNAIDDLKAIADYIAPTVEEDGLAHVIEKFVLSEISSTKYPSASSDMKGYTKTP